MNLTDLFNDFLKHGKYLRNWSSRTAHTYGQGFASFQQSLVPTTRNSPVNADDFLNKAQLEAWVIRMHERGLTPGGANMYIRTINSFCS